MSSDSSTTVTVSMSAIWLKLITVLCLSCTALSYSGKTINYMQMKNVLVYRMSSTFLRKGIVSVKLNQPFDICFSIVEYCFMS